MKILWKFLGLDAIPVVTIFVKKLAAKKVDENHIALLQQYRQEMGACKRCYELVSIKMGMRHIMHLIDDHGIEPNISYEIIGDLYNRINHAMSAQQPHEPTR